MMPQLTPTNWFSAFWQSRAMALRSLVGCLCKREKGKRCQYFHGGGRRESCSLRKCRGEQDVGSDQFGSPKEEFMEDPGRIVSPAACRVGLDGLVKVDLDGQRVVR